MTNPTDSDVMPADHILVGPRAVDTNHVAVDDKPSEGQPLIMVRYTRTASISKKYTSTDLVDAFAEAVFAVLKNQGYDDVELMEDLSAAAGAIEKERGEG